MSIPASPSKAAPTPLTVGEYLSVRLLELGVEHVFGVPGDYSLGLCDMMINSGLRWVGCCNELNAGYAADAYARIRGLSASCVTYGVGGFSLINATAGGHAENVPMVCISGAPPSCNYLPNELAMPHHALQGNLMAQFQAFSAVTVKAVLLLTNEGAAEQIDETLRLCLMHCLPVFIELPSDVAAMPCPGGRQRLSSNPAAMWMTAPPNNTEATNMAVKKCAEALLTAKRPAILAGVEVIRRDAQDSVRRLARMLRLPVATTRHGKTALEEGGTICAGVYAGGLSREPVRKYIEGADVLVMLGAPKTDMDFFFCNLDDSRMAMFDVHGDTVTVHVPPPLGKSEPLAAKLQLGEGIVQPVLRVPHEVFGPISLKGFIDALSLYIFDHLGEVQPMAISALALSPLAKNKPNFSRIEVTAMQTWDGALNAATNAVERRNAIELQIAKPFSNGLAPETPLTNAGFFRSFEAWLHAQPMPVTILADTGDSLFATSDIALRPNDKFMTQAFYCSIGFTVPAVVGAAHAHQTKALSALGTNASLSAAGRADLDAHYAKQGGMPPRRLVCLVGDGAFQMTAQEVSIAVRDNLPITYFLLNNKGYGIERLIHNGPTGNDYNDIHDWHYAGYAQAFRLGEDGRPGIAKVASNEGELSAVLAAANQKANMCTCNFIEIQVSDDDFSEPLREVGKALRSKNKLPENERH